MLVAPIKKSTLEYIGNFIYMGQLETKVHKGNQYTESNNPCLR